MKRAAHIADFLAIIVLGWMGLASLPLSTFWFDPQLVIVSDGPASSSPGVGFTREIKRPVRMQYSGVIRNAELAVACEFSLSGVIPYRPDAKLPEHPDLDWWTNGKCSSLPTGLYLMETCWTAVDRFWGLLPDRTICATSNPFRVW